jgi:hypothetical protein
MADLDDETVERVRQWCAEAGRQAGAAEIRAALAPLAWDELLNVRAFLADPPPARPLGPAALADLARGAPPDVAAEREREGRYRAEREVDPGEPTNPSAPRPAARSRRARRPVPPIVHRKRDAAVSAPPPPPAAPALDELRRPAGRAVLEQLLRREGARRPRLIAALAGWRRADGGAPDDADLSSLLDHHGLARAFTHREREELLHALRAARGELAAAAGAAGLAPEDYRAALDRLGAWGDAERIREERRAELRGRATLAERARLLSQEAERLADLGLLAEMEADLAARLPEHLRALRAGARGPLAAAFALSLSLPEADAREVAKRTGLDLGPPPERRAPGTGTAGSRRAAGGPRRSSGGPRRAAGGARPAAGGPRPAPGGPRRAAGGARPVPGGPRRAGGGPGRRQPGTRPVHPARPTRRGGKR